MAVEKAAPILDSQIVSAACRAALDHTVDRFTQVIEAAKPEAIRRKFKNSSFDVIIDPIISVANGAVPPITVKSKSRK